MKLYPSQMERHGSCLTIIEWAYSLEFPNKPTTSSECKERQEWIKSYTCDFINVRGDVETVTHWTIWDDLMDTYFELAELEAFLEEEINF